MINTYFSQSSFLLKMVIHFELGGMVYGAEIFETSQQFLQVIYSTHASVTFERNKLFVERNETGLMRNMARGGNLYLSGTIPLCIHTAVHFNHFFQYLLTIIYNE